MTRTKNGSKLYKVLSRLAPEEMKVKSSKFSNTKTPHYTTTLLLYIDLTCVTGNNNNKKPYRQNVDRICPDLPVEFLSVYVK